MDCGHVWSEVGRGSPAVMLAMDEAKVYGAVAVGTHDRVFVRLARGGLRVSGLRDGRLPPLGDVEQRTFHSTLGSIEPRTALSASPRRSLTGDHGAAEARPASQDDRRSCAEGAGDKGGDGVCSRSTVAPAATADTSATRSDKWTSARWAGLTVAAERGGSV